MLPCISNTSKFCICSFYFPFSFFPQAGNILLNKTNFQQWDQSRAMVWSDHICIAHTQVVATKTTLLGGKTHFLQVTCLCLMSGCLCFPWSGRKPRVTGQQAWDRLLHQQVENLVVRGPGASLCFFKYPFKHSLYAFTPSKGRRGSVPWKAWCKTQVTSTWESSEQARLLISCLIFSALQLSTPDTQHSSLPQYWTQTHPSCKPCTSSAVP